MNILVKKYIDSIISKNESMATSGHDKTCFPHKNIVILKSKNHNSDINITKSQLKLTRSFINKVRLFDNVNIPKLIYYTTSANDIYQIQQRGNGSPIGFWKQNSFVTYFKTHSPKEYLQTLKEQERYYNSINNEEPVSLENSDEKEFIKIAYLYEANANSLSPLSTAQTKHNNQSIKNILECDNKHLIKFINDFCTLATKYGCQFDAHSENVLFDKNKGFSLIDIDNSNRGMENGLESNEIFENLVNNFFDFTKYQNTETYFLRGLIAKKLYYCLEQSKFNILASSDKSELNWLNIPFKFEYDNLKKMKEQDIYSKDYNECKKFGQSYFGKDFNCEEVDTDYIFDYIDKHPEYTFENPSKDTKPTYTILDKDDLAELNN